MGPEFELTYDDVVELYREVSYKLLKHNLDIMKKKLEGTILENCDIIELIKMKGVTLGNLETRYVSRPEVAFHNQDNIWRELKLDDRYKHFLNYIIDFCKSRCLESIDKNDYINKISEARKNDKKFDNNCIKKFSDGCYKITHHVHVYDFDEELCIFITAIYVIYFDKNDNFIDIIPNELIIIPDPDDRLPTMEHQNYYKPESILPDEYFDNFVLTCDTYTVKKSEKPEEENIDKDEVVK